MDVAVHGEGEVAMPRDVLQRLRIHAGFVEHRQIAVAKDVGGRAVQINSFANLLEHTLIRRSRDGRLLLADDVAGFLGRSEHLSELRIERKAAKAVRRLGRGHLSLIVGVGRNLCSDKNGAERQKAECIGRGGSLVGFARQIGLGV